MSQSRGERALEFSPLAWNDTSLLNQAKLSARRARRAVKAAERQEKSDALKEEGNTLFRNGNFQGALERYQQAINVHGRSTKPLLLANLSAAYLKLGMYSEAHDAADKALVADPTSVKARYRRGMARKHMNMLIAAAIDFRMVLVLDPENRQAEAELTNVEEICLDPSHWEEEEEDPNSFTDYEAPALEDDPQFEESLSESSDCEHTGNGFPCKFYNRTGCKNGHACRFSHAPDDKSERDALGRNVCRHYLIGSCGFGERCIYLHSKEYLSQNGWWSTTEGIDKEKERYNVVQMPNKAITDSNDLTKASGKGQASKKKKPKGKKKRDNRSREGFGSSEPGSAASKNQSTQLPPPSGIEQSSQKLNKKKHTVYSYPSWDEYGSDRDEDSGIFGFTGSEVDELLCQGVKPWDDDAWDVLNALHSYY